MYDTFEIGRNYLNADEIAEIEKAIRNGDLARMWQIVDAKDSNNNFVLCLNRYYKTQSGTLVSVIDGKIRNLGSINHNQYCRVSLEVINEETGEKKYQTFSVPYLVALNDPRREPSEVSSVQPHHREQRRQSNHRNDIDLVTMVENCKSRHDPLRKVSH